jgi:hypothetical protein
MEKPQKNIVLFDSLDLKSDNVTDKYSRLEFGL